jgi:hypothetical protein
MKKPAFFSRWLRKRRFEIYASVWYGIIATILYLAAGLKGGGFLGMWIVLYYIGFPVSWAFNQAVARVGDYLPDSMFCFLYNCQVIVAGMVWIYILTLVMRKIIIRLRSLANTGGRESNENRPL